MTNPFAINPGGVVQGVGPGPVMGQGIADVLAQMQIGKENQYRQQELQNQMMQQQALQQYYQAQAQAEQQRIAAKAQEDLYVREGLKQRGQAVQNFMTGQPGVVQPGQTTMPQQDSGNIFRDLTAGGSAAIGGQQGYDRLFNGVSPENVPDALGDLKNAQALMPQAPAPEKPTSDMQNYMAWTQAAGLDPRDPKALATFKQMIGGNRPEGMKVIMPPGQTAFSTQYGENAANAVSDIEKQALTQSQSFPALSEAYKLVGKSFTGFGANQVVGLGRVVNALGGNFKPGGKSVEDTQTLLKLTREQTLAYLQTRALGSGTAVSDKDREFMERQSAADITLEPTSIRRIIRINVGSGIMRMTDAITALREAAMGNPAEAAQLNQKAFTLQKRLDPIWAQYAKMLKDEDQMSGVDVNGVLNSAFPVR